jgi:hypothetical protein
MAAYGDAPVHAAAPPVGFVELRTFPAVSTATHNVVNGHETGPRRGWHDDPEPP